MSNAPSSQPRPHHMLAILCLGIFAGAMALNSIPAGEIEMARQDNILWNVFQYVLPLLMGAICLTGKRWGIMATVIYATIGLSLDLATLVQSIIAGSDSIAFTVIVLTTSLLNFSLIAFGGKYLLTQTSLKKSAPY